MNPPPFPRQRRPARPAWLPYALAICLIALAGCSRKQEQAQAAIPVIALPVRAVDGAVAGRFPGEVHARHETALAFRIGGQLQERYVDPGERVKQGQALARLDPADATKQLANAKAALDAAEHRLTFAIQQHDRDDAQFKQNLISQLQWQQTQDSYATALAGRDQARQQYELAQNQLHYTTLLADHDGVITSRQAEVGQVLAAGQQVFGFAWDDGLEVYVDVPESRVGGIAIGQAATLTVPALPHRSYTARVREIAPAADAASRTYLVKLALDHPDASLQLGMTADVSLQAGKAAVDAVAIPATALFHQGEHPAVWVVNPADSTLALRPVTVSRYGERDVLLAAGVKPGERVLMQGVHAVSAGEKVAPIAPPHAEDAPQ